ncbi:MAG: murein biosynthesis integral membrane protein MurJ, partial [Sulfuricella sp.]|nr:murein biosynthesis integral membrane protein MurJ [Sulfuricella sp.]
MNLLKALATIGSMTLLSRILGFLRDTIIARAFGAGLYTDAFFVAFKLPNMMRRLFAEGAFSQAFVPILAEYKTRRGHDATRDLIDHVATFLGLVLVGVSLIGILAAPAVIYISAPGFADSAEKFDLTVQLLRFIFPYIFFISLVSLAGGVLNTYSKFSVPAFTPVLLNLSFIACALWLAPYMHPPVMALAVAVLLGGVLQLGVQLPYLAKIGFLPRFRLNLKDEGVWRVMKLMGPAVFGVSIAQISLLINTIFASFLETGSVSWLYYADRLMEFPTGILGVALGTILLPSLAKHYADDSPEQFSSLLDWGLRLTLMLALPAALALAILAVPLISTLFYYGKFTAHDLWMTREALMAYSAGLLGLIMVKVLAPGFYSRQNIKTPVKIAIFTLLAT